MKLLFTLLAILPITIFGQKTDSLKIRRASIGLTFSPDYCYRTLKATNSSADVFVNLSNDREIPKLGFTTGINFAYAVSKRFTLETGILYSDRGEKTKKQDFYFVDAKGNQNIDPALPASGYFLYHYTFIDVPLKINYNLLERKLKLYVTVGALPAFFISYKTTLHATYRDGHTKTTTSTIKNVTKFAKVNLAVIAGAGLSYDFTSRLYLKLEPVYRYSLTPLVDNAPVHGYLYSFGLNTGVFFKL